MRTVSTLCATGLGVSLSAVGLTIARHDEPSQSAHRRTPDMTAVATYTVPTVNPLHPHRNPNPNTLDHHSDAARRRSFSSYPRSNRPSHDDWHHGPRAHTSHARTSHPHNPQRDLMPRASAGLGMDTPSRRDDDVSQRAATPGSRPSSWLRRFSGGMPSSRDSSRTPSSRPSSAARAPSTASGTFTINGSTTPMLPETPSAPYSPNKLVKRASSVRGTASSPLRSPGSRLPLPVLKRPATSHQRKASLQKRLSIATTNSEGASADERNLDTPEKPWRHYFTPRIAGQTSSAKSPTGIPNPIRRLYPDRKYTPVLISGKERVKTVRPEVDDSFSEDDSEDMAIQKTRAGISAASSPVPVQTAHFGATPAPKRAFSIGDLLSTGPQPMWKQPSSLRGRTPSNKLQRKSRQRIVSAPMGNSTSHAAGLDSGRPAKRRDVSDPMTSQRSIYTSSSTRTSETRPLHEIQLNLSSTNTPSPRLPSFGSPISEKPTLEDASSPLVKNRLSSATPEWTASHHARVSATQSEILSTIGSDSEYRSVGEYSTDYQSDTVYDSIPTRTTRSSSGKRGPPIDTIFDEPHLAPSSERSTRLRDLLSDGGFPHSDHTIGNRHSTIEEEGSIVSTPVRSIRDKSVTSTPSGRPHKALVFSSSPPVMNIMPDPDDIDWDSPGDVDEQSPNTTPHMQRTVRFPEMNLPVLNPFSRSWNSASNTPNRNANGSATLFDWAEQQPSPTHANQSPPRPRTVHGKKDSDNRGSRTTGRRAPSGMHARSHSVPVVPDIDGKRTNVVANKFGTWGVGSKGVTEDWNEDFDFDDELPGSSETMQIDERRIDSGHEMFVPKTIREQQQNIVANIGLLREWGLLIEELKDLRIRAVALDMLRGPYAQAWAEVDAMIELADQESEENTLEPRKSPPSSPGFDFAAFEESLPSLPTNERSRNSSFMLAEPAFPNFDTARQTVRDPATLTTPPKVTVTTRPRKDSEAVARSVIEALQTKRSTSDPAAVRPVSASKKVPFDTATLRHIVPYVNGLKRKVKDALRETEGLYTSPRRRTLSIQNEGDRDEDDEDEPAFRSIFNEPQIESSPATRRLRRERAETDHDGYEDAFHDQRSDLANRMEAMRLPQ